MRIKSDIVLPLLEALPDGSYRSFLADRTCCIPLRVIEYDVKVPGRDNGEDELYALATTLMDWRAYPAAELAASYPDRWNASETTIGQDKSAIIGAGPSTGPMLRSATPHQVIQEMWAWVTATQLLRIHGCRAVLAAAAGQLTAGPRTPAAPAVPDRVPFTVTHREAVRALTQTLAPASASAAALAAAAERTSGRILARLLPDRPPRHRERRTKGRARFPSAASRRVPASTGAATVTVSHAGQIIYADGRTGQATATARDTS